MTPLRIYIASASADAADVASILESLERSGHYRVTHNWAREVLAAKEEPNVEAQRALHPTQRFKIAQVDLHAVISADVVWLRVPDAVSYGCWVEWGAACIAARLQPRTLVVSGDWSKCLFTEMCNRSFKTHAEALAALLEGPRSFNPKQHAYAGSGDT